MHIEVLTQSVIGNIHWRCVGDVLNAVVARTDCQRFRFAVAYMRVSGLRLLYGTLQALRDRSGHIAGAVGIDQGITTIEALELLRQLSSDSTIVCTVSNYIYHPKLYLAEGGKWASAVVSSANLTRDGLYRNVELATIIHLDLGSSTDVEIYQYYDAFLSELLNPDNPNVQLLNETTLKWLAETIMIEDEAHVPEPQSVIRSKKVTAKLKDLFPSLPVPSVPTTNEAAPVLNTGKETSAVPFEKLPSRSDKERSLLVASEATSISSAMSFPVSLPEDNLAEPLKGETTSSSLLTHEVVHKENMLDLLKQGAVVWNQWRKEHRQFFPDLSGVDLHGRDLRSFNFSGVNFQGADLHGANLFGVNLGWATLTGTDLKKAILVNAMLANADLRGADLRGADLTRAWLMEATITGVRLQETRRSQWFIEGIICETVYWGAKPRSYKAGEFEQRHSSVRSKKGERPMILGPSGA